MPGELATALRRLEPALGALEGEPVALDGGITNRNYRVTLGGAPLVVRLCGKRTGPLGIDRDTECLAAERASELSGDTPDRSQPGYRRSPGPRRPSETRPAPPRGR